MERLTALPTPEQVADSVVQEQINAGNEIRRLKDRIENFTAWLGRLYGLCGGRFSAPAEIEEMETFVEQHFKQGVGTASPAASPSRTQIDPFSGSGSLDMQNTLFGSFLQ
jgi:hypothetical protein